MTRRVRLIVWFVLGSAAMGLFLAILYILLNGARTTQVLQDNQSSNHQLLTRLVALSHHIDDCTNRGGDCYSANAKRTGQALAALNQAGAARAACAVVLSRQTHLQTAAQLSRRIDRCTTETVARLQHPHQ